MRISKVQTKAAFDAVLGSAVVDPIPGEDRFVTYISGAAVDALPKAALPECTLSGDFSLKARLNEVWGGLKNTPEFKGRDVNRLELFAVSDADLEKAFEGNKDGITIIEFAGKSKQERQEIRAARQNGATNVPSKARNMETLEQELARRQAEVAARIRS